MSLIDDLSLFIIDATDARKEKTILFPLPTILFQLWAKIWTLQESVTTISGSICLLVTSGHHEKNFDATCAYTSDKI